MGTKYAIETALCGSLFPESEVEEWFQHEGEPGHFHIVLDVTNQRITADYAAIIRAVKMYKRLSAHMDELTYQGQVHGVAYTHGEYFRYKHRDRKTFNEVLFGFYRISLLTLAIRN
ncbi:MAG: phage tail protein [Ruminococcus callidus]